MAKKTATPSKKSSATAASKAKAKPTATKTSTPVKKVSVATKSTTKTTEKPTKKVAKPVKKTTAPKLKAEAKPVKGKVPKEKIVQPKELKELTAKPKSETKSKKIIVAEKPLPEVFNEVKYKSVKSILISQPKPELGKSPYIDLASEFKIKLDWRPFTHVQGLPATDFRKSKVYIDQYNCVIFTSRFAIEHYFRLCEEMRIKINEDNKYFCINEAIALYLQKFIQYRKRKVFYGDGKLPKLMEVILKHKENSTYLLPCSDVRDKAFADVMAQYDIRYTEAIIYKTVASDLSDLSDVKYDMLVFFNPSAIDSLYINFPKFSQDETRLAIFGTTTADAVKAHGLKINVYAPTPENPSLVDAIRKYIKQANKR